MTRAAVRRQVIGLLGLSAIGAELLSAYGDSTGDPAAIAFSIVFFAALYGAPALLARDAVRQIGGGWPSLLLAFGALGVLQACVIDQSMFSTDYQGYEGWEEDRAATLIPALGISGHNAYNFIVGHMIYSFGAPVAVAEAWIPERAHRPWLGPLGTTLAVGAYLGTAALILSEPESHAASQTQLVVSILLVVLLIAAAVALARRPRTAGGGPGGSARHAPSVAVVLGGTFVGALVASLGEETWFGLALGVLGTAAVGLGVLIGSRCPGWTIRHSAAVGLAFLLVRGLLAFLYYPLAGDVGAAAKYTHNVVMLALVLLAGWFALRPRNSVEAPTPSQPLAG